jgi:hypothetical protein
VRQSSLTFLYLASGATKYESQEVGLKYMADVKKQVVEERAQARAATPPRPAPPPPAQPPSASSNAPPHPTTRPVGALGSLQLLRTTNRSLLTSNGY